MSSKKANNRSTSQSGRNNNSGKRQKPDDNDQPAPPKPDWFWCDSDWCKGWHACYRHIPQWHEASGMWIGACKSFYRCNVPHWCEGHEQARFGDIKYHMKQLLDNSSAVFNRGYRLDNFKATPSLVKEFDHAGWTLKMPNVNVPEARRVDWAKHNPNAADQFQVQLTGLTRAKLIEENRELQRQNRLLLAQQVAARAPAEPMDQVCSCAGACSCVNGELAKAIATIE
jgi:hypothetical protein